MNHPTRRPFDRTRFWACGLALWVIGIAAVEGLAHMLGQAPAAAGAAVLLALNVWLCLQRLRDRRRSPAWLLILLIPLLGPLWLLVDLGLRAAPVSHNPSSLESN